MIGSGPSAIDLVMMLTDVGKSVAYSRKKPLANSTEDEIKKQKDILPKAILKDQIKRFTADGAEFIDGTHQIFSTIIYATGEWNAHRINRNEIKFKFKPYLGYKYSYPFLSVESDIHVDENFVQSLYKHVINIEHPTMAFIGVTTTLFTYSIMNTQVKEKTTKCG